MKHSIRKHITYANVMATCAIFIALGGTSYAALVVTGKHVKDGTLTGSDVKDGTLAALDLTADAKMLMRGQKGDQGLQGGKGDKGDTGLKGDTGPAGDPAQIVTSYASRDTGYVTSNARAIPNPNSLDWFEYNCGATDPVSPANADINGPCADDDGNQRLTNVGHIPMIASYTPVIALQGMTNSGESHHVLQTKNNIVAPFSSNLSAVASMTFHHQGDGGTTIHERIRCKLQYANASSPSTFTDLGQPHWVSSDVENELVQVTVVGSGNVGSGTYNVQVTCQDANYTSPVQDHLSGWWFVKGDMTVMAAKNN